MTVATAPSPKLAGFMVENVSFSYGETPVLKDLNLSIHAGEFLCLLGPSGSGKTTLQRLLAGLERPTTGRVTWMGGDITGPSSERGMVFQDYSLYPWMTLAENIGLALEKADPSLSRGERRDRAGEYLGSVGLHGTAGKYPFELSGGMQQRAAIARALALNSRALLLDEPFGALDPLNRAKLQDLLTSIWQDATPRRTVVFVTHDVEEAIYLGSRVLVLGSSPGRVIGEVQVPFPRPRQRRELFASPEFRRLSDAVSGHYHSDVLEHLNAAAAVTSQGEGI
jgi:NitT/TauT family transport system ATP-binding protein